MAAGLANGVSARELHQLFTRARRRTIRSEPDLLLSPALGEYARRMISFPTLFAEAAQHYPRDPFDAGFFESFTELARALPAGMFDNPASAIGWRSISQEGCTNDFPRSAIPNCFVATDLDILGGGRLRLRGTRSCADLARGAGLCCPARPVPRPWKPTGRHYVDALKKDAASLLSAARRGKIADLRQSDRVVRRRSR